MVETKLTDALSETTSPKRSKPNIVITVPENIKPCEAHVIINKHLLLAGSADASVVCKGCGLDQLIRVEGGFRCNGGERAGRKAISTLRVACQNWPNEKIEAEDSDQSPIFRPVSVFKILERYRSFLPEPLRRLK